MTPRAYNGWIIGGTLALLMPLIALNLMLLANDTRHDKNRLASEWQQQTGGVTYPPPISNNQAFKILRLADRLPEIDAVVFGSSTMLTVGAEVFPPGWRLYNFAQTGNPLLNVIGETEALLDTPQSRVRLLVVPLDWALGFVYAEGTAARVDLIAVNVPAPRPISWDSALREAMSLPRSQALVATLAEIARSNDRASTARRLFYEAADEPYRCADGALARDFDPLFRGKCVGFRADGSATFADQKRVSEASAPAVLAQAASASSQYARGLKAVPAESLLAQLSRLQQAARSKNVRILFLMPPLLPQLDARLAASAHSGEKLRGTKAALTQWAARGNATLVDAGPSERFGCTATEFIDAHHAWPSCYRKIFAQLQALPVLKP